MHFVPENSFYPSKFQHPFASNEANIETSAEPRVHHIPIQVESRNATSTPMAKPVFTNSQQQNSGTVPSQSAPTQTSHPIHTTATTSSFSDFKPTRVIDVPIQITKSSSTPETSRKCENTFQQSSTSVNTGPPQAAHGHVNESSSDPAIADPNKVYAMGYEPLNNNSNQTEKPTADESKKETPFDYVKEILDDLKNYESQVHEFNGTNSNDKGYKFLDEMLTLCILRLDCINIDGNDELRKYRKSAINEVNRVAAILESKLSKQTTTTEQQQNDNQIDTAVVQNNTESLQAESATALPSAEPKDKKEGNKKSEKTKTKKEKAKKEPSEKKEGRRIILFRGKSKNKPNTADTESSDNTSMDVDPNNNDLKNDSNQTANDTNSDVASTSSNSTLQGKETAV